MDFLGFIAAILTLVAALFGLIPPLLSKAQAGGQSDESVSGFVKALTPIVVIGGMLGIYFLYMFGMTALPRYMMSRPEKEIAEIKGVSDADWNLVRSAEMLTYSGERDAALVRIIDHAIANSDFPLAILATSNLSYSSQRDEQLVRIQGAMLSGPKPIKGLPSPPATE